ncbi:MAG TPA: hypothetical protein PKH24_18105 [Sedimentisphaerales bacterium]|nr:hypothetical protein [Sedimentisphaerales bacterium]HNU28812.1 hypothetical protein [Sedimentisphaerales bacterium]
MGLNITKPVSPLTKAGVPLEKSIRKGAKSSNVKEYAKSGLNWLQEGVMLRVYAATTLLGWAFTFTKGVWRSDVCYA